MSGVVLSYAGAASVLIWGVAHLLPTRGTVKGFGDISRENRLILTMEWITEGVSLISIGTVVGVVSWVDHGSVVALSVFWVTSGTLLALGVLSLFTGFRVSFLPYKLCPFIFTGSAILILCGAYLN